MYTHTHTHVYILGLCDFNLPVRFWSLLIAKNSSFGFFGSVFLINNCFGFG